MGIACILLLSATVQADELSRAAMLSYTCAGCHGTDGISQNPLYPHIGGQYRDYLLHSLRGYKSGERQNAIMQGMVAALSDEDMQDLAAYFASLEGVLKAGGPNP